MRSCGSWRLGLRDIQGLTAVTVLEDMLLQATLKGVRATLTCSPTTATSAAGRPSRQA